MTYSRSTFREPREGKCLEAEARLCVAVKRLGGRHGWKRGTGSEHQRHRPLALSSSNSACLSQCTILSMGLAAAPNGTQTMQ